MEALGPDVHHSDRHTDRTEELQPGFENHCRNAGVPRIRVYDTQHTCASLLAALDVHPRVAMRILRHSQISMTMDVYTQIPSPETHRALDHLSQRLDGSDAT